MSRLRQVILLLNLILAAVFVQFVNASSIEATYISIISCALIWLCWRWILIVRQRTQLVYWDIAEGVAFGLIGIGLSSPFDASGIVYMLLLYGALTFHALTLSIRRVIISTLCYLIAYCSVLLYVFDELPNDEVLQFGLLPLPGLALLAVLGSITARAFISQSQEERLRTKLDRASTLLGTVMDEEHLATATGEVAVDLIPDSKLAVCLLARGSQETLVVLPGETEIIVLDETPVIELIAERQRMLLESGEVVEMDADSLELIAAHTDLTVETPMYGVPLCSGSAELNGILIVETPGILDDSQINALKMFGRQTTLAVERVQSLQDLRWREEAYRSLVHHALNAMVVITVETTIQYEAPAFSSLLGQTEIQLGDQFMDLVHPEDARSVIAALTELVDEPESSEIFECRLQCGDGSWLAVEVSAHNRLDDAAVSGLVLSCRDISERKELESRLNHQAFHDPLTDLPNRAQFLSRMGTALEAPMHEGDFAPLVAVLFLDLDRFKTVNDSLGHDAGDYLLRVTAERLRDCVRPSDIVARFGGDEFAILLEDLRNEDFAHQVAKRVIASLQAPLIVGGQQLYVSTSVGIAFGRAGAVDPEEMLHRADIAMYSAKREGKGRYRVYDTSMVANALDQLQLESELHEAIQQGTLEIYYQPLISLQNGEICQLEALVRWPHPTRGLLAPDNFIPLAEETGQIILLDTWVLEQVCQQLQQRLKQSTGSESIAPISVNLSALQFQQPHFAVEVERVLRTWSIPPALLKLEITEGIMMHDEQQTIETISKLRQMGIKVAIDDFGVGYSSLSALRRFDVDTLKIDRSFIAGLGRDRGDTAIIQAMITFGTTVGMTVVAEGIETEEQLLHLQALGCDVGQGYFLARPYPSLNSLRPVRDIGGATSIEGEPVRLITGTGKR